MGTSRVCGVRLTNRAWGLVAVVLILMFELFGEDRSRAEVPNAAILRGVMSDGRLPAARTQNVGPAETVDSVTPIVEQMSTSIDRSHSTFRLSLRLRPDLLNIYTIFGDRLSPIVMPPAYQSGQPFGANLGGINPGLVKVSQAGSARFDSWLTVGPTEGAADGQLGSNPAFECCAFLRLYR